MTSLTDILNAGVDVCMVQVGNEINKGMSGETFVPSVAELLKAGSSAVREVSKAAGKDIQVAVHYTDIDKQGEVAKITADLDKYGVDYDILQCPTIHSGMARWRICRIWQNMCRTPTARRL